MRIMKPIRQDSLPDGAGWLYEIKYDGFRACLTASSSGDITLTSKNAQDLSEKFPEVVEGLHRLLPDVEKYLPFALDGELVVLNHAYQANFAEIQKRGRMRNEVRIREQAARRPASYIAFDVIKANGKDYREKPLTMRKQILDELLGSVLAKELQPIEVLTKAEAERLVFSSKGEGIVAKRKNSRYQEGKQHQDWLKIKNWRRIHGFLTTYTLENGYFDVAVFDEAGEVKNIGKCKHGLKKDAFEALKNFFMTNGEKNGNRYTLPPAICAAIHTLDLYDGELREPEFAAIIPEMKPVACTMRQLELDQAMLPESVELTNTDKFLWKRPAFTKGNLLAYMREIAPFMLPFLKDRLLTVIRAPDGVHAEQFFQKHRPDYAPEFVTAVPLAEDEVFTSCDRLEALIWFANHGAVEYHVPFQRAGSLIPQEIVFDLDPPERDAFPLAVKAAQLIKLLLDELRITAFVKTSGNKGLQIHIPIPEGSMTYEETAVFTQAIAFTAERQFPELFTTERMKKNRGGKLYIDYVQHGKDKTIIAPYSPRKTTEGTVATPIFWNELSDELNPLLFTIATVPARVKEKGCPFATYNEARSSQPMKKLLELVRSGVPETG